jgi:hypothetical protein
VPGEVNIMVVSVLTAVLLLAVGTVPSEARTTLGTVEEVILLPWGVRLPVRIDTGAAKSSLDARELNVEGDMVEFKLPEGYGGLKLRLPVLEWRHVRTPRGKERRPVVEIELCLGPKRILGKVNLTDRSSVKYPMIIGRNFLRENFIVDVRRRRVAGPSCQEDR